MSQISSESRRVSALAKMAFKAQIFLLRRNWMGPAGNIIMIITTIGRKSGKAFTTPIGYQWDGDTVLTFNVGRTSNWYKNLAQNPLVTLEIKKKTYKMRAAYVTDTQEIRQILELYKCEQTSALPRFFGVPADSSGDDLMKAADKVGFVRFSAV
ncbi:MAG: nitroreductase family deazaflavin-dependent oxidoreductase [Anaerolineae bacterium]|nr:nitroreductase family deazaflavin-dependent oxidoreductase [Anaerolineae bacterium]